MDLTNDVDFTRPQLIGWTTKERAAGGRIEGRLGSPIGGMKRRLGTTIQTMEPQTHQLLDEALYYHHHCRLETISMSSIAQRYQHGPVPTSDLANCH